MPSGFQNDTNQLQAEMHRVVITMSNTTFYPTADGPDNGAVTPNSSDSFILAQFPTTLITAKARARGNMRFRNVVNALTGLSDCQIRDITISEPNADAQAASLAFTVAYDRPAFVPVTGTAIDGATAITTTALAIRNTVAIAIRATTEASCRVVDPVVSPNDFQLTLTVSQTGATAAQTFGTVAVSLIDESTLFD